jgi:hypothetical protein
VLRDDLKALVARARTDAEDKSLGAGERRERREQLGEDVGSWVERFDQWVKDEGQPEFGVSIQKPAEPRDGQPPPPDGGQK